MQRHNSISAGTMPWLMLAAGLGLFACGGGSGGHDLGGGMTDDTDTGSDGDSDADGDTDSDTDGDTDSDTDVDAGEDAGAKIPNVVFVTSTAHASNALGGLAGADAICAERAATAGLEGTYVAWLSTSEGDAKDRLAGSRGWVRTDGLPFADEVSDLTAGVIWYPPRLDELGNEVDPLTFVSTGTSPDGTAHADLLCNDWTYADAGVAGDAGVTGDAEIGSAYGGTDIWTNWGNAACDIPRALYCFGIGNDTPVAPQPQSGRIAFVSAAAFMPGGGLAAADARCQAEAAAASLAGTFRALLAAGSASAASRFSAAGAAWVRRDGVPVASSAAAFLGGELPVAAIALAADGKTYLGNTGVWSGAAAVDETPGADMTCSDWTAATAAEHGRGGRAGTTSPFFFDMDSNGCGDTWIHLLCLEE
ncbi:MAG: hypothetical protein PHU25_09060 [Deltaproteobacteria bacterium]|nr:hypothetical protein [Deltaproteobacteria bacterium]